MALLPLAKPAETGIDPARYQKAVDLLRNWAETDKVPSIGMCVGRKGKAIEPVLFGRQRVAKDSPPLRKDALFLIASITKPLTVGAALMLLERGLIVLDDRVKKFIPKFTGDGRDDITVRHIM